MRRFFVVTLVMALVGDIAAIFIAPKMIHYWFEPPVAAGAQAAFNCTGALDWGIQRLIAFQLWATLAGAVIGMIFAFLLWRRASKQAALVPAGAAPAPALPATTPAAKT